MSAERIFPSEDHLTKLKQVYSRLWNHLDGVEGLAIDTDQDAINAVRDNHDECILIGTIPDSASASELPLGNDYLRFKNAKYNLADPTDQMDICLQFIKRIEVHGEREDPRFVLTDSNIAISYLRYEGGPNEYTDDDTRPVNLVQSYHFDYEYEYEDPHPVFHLQSDPFSINLEVLDDEYEIRNRSDLVDRIRPNFPRIPSAPLGFSGVIFSILREHARDFDIWPSRVKSPLQQVPSYPDDLFDPSPQCGNAMIPEWWYAHSSENDHFTDQMMKFRFTT